MPIHVVTLENQHEYMDVLPRMFIARRSLYEQGVGWAGIKGDDGRDVDVFDHDRTAYLLNLDKENRLHAACRLIPSDASNICHARFRHLAAGSLPLGKDVFELSRWMAIPNGQDTCASLQELACGVMEYSILQRIRQFIMLGGVGLVREFDLYGWVCRRLTATASDRHAAPSVGLYCIDAGCATLTSTRTATRTHHAVLCVELDVPQVPSWKTEDRQGHSVVDEILHHADAVDAIADNGGRTDSDSDTKKRTKQGR